MNKWVRRLRRIWCAIIWPDAIIFKDRYGIAAVIGQYAPGLTGTSGSGVMTCTACYKITPDGTDWENCHAPHCPALEILELQRMLLR